MFAFVFGQVHFINEIIFHFVRGNFHGYRKN